MIHKFILASLFPLGTPHAKFLQDRTIIREYRLIALYPRALRITQNSRVQKIPTGETKSCLEKVEAGAAGDASEER
jgi:hypothetical protein